MGTRSLIYFQARDSDGKVVIYVVIYQQYDGYPEGVGATLAEFLSKVNLVNGFTRKDEEEKERIVCNGFDDLVARFIAQHKSGVGGFYIYPAVPDMIEEFVYHVTNTDEGIRISINSGKEMNISEFSKVCSR